MPSTTSSAWRGEKPAAKEKLALLLAQGAAMGDQGPGEAGQGGEPRIGRSFAGPQAGDRFVRQPFLRCHQAVEGHTPAASVLDRVGDRKGLDLGA